MAAVNLASSAHSVYPMGEVGKPDFGGIGKPVVTVDVARLQAELRGLNHRIELLEIAAMVAAEERQKEEDLDGGSGSSAGARAVPAAEAETGGVVEDPNGGHTADDLTVESQGERRCGLLQHNLRELCGSAIAVCATALCTARV